MPTIVPVSALAAILVLAFWVLPDYFQELIADRRARRNGTHAELKAVTDLKAELLEQLADATDRLELAAARLEATHSERTEVLA